MKRYCAPILLASVLVFMLACENMPGENSMLTDNFDRAKMLEFWADEVIIPTYSAYNNTLDQLSTETTNFYTEPTVDGLRGFRSAWLESYGAWQEAAMFEIGRAEEIGLTNFTNIYPTNVELITNNINEANYNLVLPSNFSAQGFPALDYLLYGLAESEEEIVAALSDSNTESYVVDLVDRLVELSADVLADWNESFRDEFISNSGSSASASVDKMVNDFLFYYERNQRAAKVGIPAGKFSGSEQPDLVEGRYSMVYSKQLFRQSFSAVEKFFRGESFDGLTTGVSLEQYLDDIRVTNDTDFDIAAEVIAQWEQVDLALDKVSDSLESQVLNDNTQMLALYDAMQVAVPILKVDMLQALNISVDFVDADGD